MCLQADHLEKPALLGSSCKDKISIWNLISETKMHISSTTHEGVPVCLDVDSSNTIVTSTCECVTGDKTCNPEQQWFKLVDSARNTKGKPSIQYKPILDLQKDYYVSNMIDLAARSTA